jgi:hypothetical protein
LVVAVPISLVYSIYDSTEVAIQKTIEATQKIIDEGNDTDRMKEGFGGMNAVTISSLS